MADIDKKVYDADTLYSVSGELVEQFKEGSTASPCSEVFVVNTLDMTSEGRQFVEDLASEDFNNFTDAEIEKIYDELKIKFYSNNNDKAYFKQVKKSAKAMVKADKSRTAFRHIKSAGKMTAGLAVLAGFYTSVIAKLSLGSAVDTNLGIEALRHNFDLIQAYFPESSLWICALELGIVAYAGSKITIVSEDLKTMRRLTCKMLVEKMSIKQMHDLKKAVLINGVLDARYYSPLKTYGQNTECKAQSNKTSAQKSDDLSR